MTKSSSHACSKESTTLTLATSSVSGKASSPSADDDDMSVETATTTSVGSIASAADSDDMRYIMVPEEGVVAETAKPESALKSFLAGGVGGVCVVLTGHPLDLIKVRMQTATAGSAASNSVVRMFVSTFRQQGIRGLYRGVTAPLFAVTPMFAVSFWGYDVGQRIVRKCSNASPTAELTLTQKCIAGGISAFPTTALMAPSERIKCLLQTSTPGQYKGMVDCARDVYQTGGIRSLYRGTVLTLMRDVPGSIAWFGTYEFIKLTMMRVQGLDAKELSPVAVLTAGGLAGVANWTVAIPPDVLKSRFQSAPEGTYRGIVDVYTKLMQTEGPSALFAGLRPAMIRAFPANAACFMGMEWARSVLSFMD